MINDIQKKQLLWFGLEMTEVRFPKVAMDWIPSERKKKERREEDVDGRIQNIGKAMTERNSIIYTTFKEYYFYVKLIKCFSYTP